MAEKTPDTITRESVGSLTMLICDYSDTNIDNDDTYATGLSTNLSGFWFNCSLADTAAKAVHISNSSGTSSFNTGEDDITGTLFLVAKT